MQSLGFNVKSQLQAKLMLKTWYLFLSDEYKADRINDEILNECLKTPLIYHDETNELELNFTGNKALLETFQVLLKDISKQISEE